MMNGKEKLYFLLDAIEDVRAIAPSGRPLIIDPMNDLNDKIRDVELTRLFTKLEKDEQILKVLQVPSGIKTIDIVEDLDPYDQPYEHDDGCWHIELLPAFDSYFLKIQQELEYQEFTGKKPAGSPTNPNSNALMTYERKLDLIVKAVVDARKATRKGQSTALYLNATNGLDRLDKEEIRNILLQLQDENALKINPIINRLLPLSQQPTSPNHFLLDILDGFDDWYASYLLKQKTQLENLPGSKKSVTVSADVVSNDLQAKYEEIQSEKNDTNFYLKVAGYGKYLNDNEVVHPILSQLYEESQSQINLLKISWVSFFESWKEYANNLINTADAAGIKDVGPLQNEIEEVRNFLNQPDPQFSDTDLPRYYHSYREMVLRFDKLGKKDLIAEKHLDENDNIKLFPEYNKVEVEWDKYKRMREISNWWAHYQVSRLACGIMGNQEEKTHYFKDDNEIDKLYKYEFEEIARNSSYTPVIIKRKKFEGWVTTLHSYLIPRLKEFASGNEASSNRNNDQLSEEMKSFYENQLLELNKRYEELIAQISLQTSNTPRVPKESTNSTNEDLIKCAGLTYSLGSNVLKYQKGKEIDASPETREMKFFLTLYNKRGQTVDYKELARAADLQSYKDAVGENEVAYEELENSDFSEDVSLLRRDFRSMVMSLGMPDKVFSKMITTIRKKGYKLVCK